MRLSIKVRPSSGKQEIIRLKDNEYKVFLKKPSQDNKANEELVKLLTRYFKKRVTIVSGRTSKNKIIEVIDG